jgi:hypothetical protein
MSVCDVCNGNINARSKRYSADQMRFAVRVGFRPPQQVLNALTTMFSITGIENPERYALTNWINKAMEDTSDWLLCETCAASLDATQKNARPAGQCVFCGKDIYPTDQVAMLNESILNEFVLTGAVKHPGPPSGTDKGGTPRWITCLECMDSINSRAQRLMGK